MKVGIAGLGRMGGGMAERLRRTGHEVVGFARDPKKGDVHTLKDLVSALPVPRVIWVMVTSGDPTESVIDDLSTLVSPGDILIDGGNSYYKDSIRRGQKLAEKGIHFLDIGTSGGIWGLELGFCQMAGGPPEAFKIAEPAVRALAPEGGYAYVGRSGAGHFSKMVHNGIEYGQMQAYAEGFDLLSKADFGYDLHQLAALWNHGSVIRSWLLELAESAFQKDPALDNLKGYVDDSGEGRWTVIAAVEHGVDATSIAHSLFRRFTSRDENSFAMRFEAALRNEFGGHAVKR